MFAGIRRRMDNAIARANGSNPIKVMASSWHYRMYQVWAENGGSNSIDYRENFCHYCRVVLFWPPKRWLIIKRLKTNEKDFFWFLYIVGILSLNILLRSVLLGLIVLVAGLFAGLIFRIAYVSNPEPFNRAGKVATKAIIWFFTAHRFKVVFPWSISLVLILISAIVVFGLISVGTFLLGTLLVIAAIVLIAIVLFIAVTALKWLLRFIDGILDKASNWNYYHRTLPASRKSMSSLIKPAPPVMRQKPPTAKGTPTRILIWTYLIAKKRKICPFMDLPSEAASPRFTSNHSLDYLD